MSHEWARLWRAHEDEVPDSRKWKGRDDLRLKPINVEKGSDRFPERDGVFPPTAAAWRNNLTALSQRRNLLFVAYSHQIYVWEPTGPWQKLGSTPAMTLTPTVKEPDAEGYISMERPHAINNILVDDFGCDEILLIATDSGNVSGYHVESIYSALEQAKANNEKRPLQDPHIDAFFCEYVGASAWGLAVHKLARLIAVSANTGFITVFAFALVDATERIHGREDSQEYLDYRDFSQNWFDIDNESRFKAVRRTMRDRYRSRNIRLTYTGHYTNIPSVGFLNCDLDPNGTWMVSTDISNRLLVWQIWGSLCPFNISDFSDVRAEPFPQTLRNDERGWNVLALDPRSFRLSRSYVQACGGCPYQKMNEHEVVLDLTHLRKEVPDTSHLYDYFPPATRTESDEPTYPDIFDLDCCISKEIYPQTPSLCRSSDLSSDGESISDRNPARNETNADAVDTESENNQQYVPQFGNDFEHPSQQENDETLLLDDSLDGLLQESVTTTDISQLVLQEALGGVSPDTDPEDSLVRSAEVINDDSVGAPEGGLHPQMRSNETSDGSSEDEILEMENISSQQSAGVTWTPDVDNFDRAERRHLVSDPPPVCWEFPILHFSQTDIRLLSSPFASIPSVVYGGPLRQTFTRTILSIRSYDRFNMVKYIPELGIVIAATQRGRAAVISLTEAHNKGLALRINWIVPLASQEKYADRPLLPLLGIAVSPIQGFEKPFDVSYIPQGLFDEKDLSFHYRFEESGDENLCNSDTQSDSDDEETNPSRSTKLTLPECHAIANRNYQPHERWQGWNPSRRYRLLLIYADHTVMSYEFWYEWSDAVVGENYGDGERDDFLLI